MLEIFKNGFKSIRMLFTKILKNLGLYKYKTATEILKDLKKVKYVEPDLDTIVYYNDILSMLENQYEQLEIDYSLNMISKKMHRIRLKELRKELEKYRQEYIDILAIMPCKEISNEHIQT